SDGPQSLHLRDAQEWKEVVGQGKRKKEKRTFYFLLFPFSFFLLIRPVRDGLPPVGNLNAIGEPELVADVEQVGLDGVLRHEKPTGDLRARLALGDQPHHVELTTREKAGKLRKL